MQGHIQGPHGSRSSSRKSSSGGGGRNTLRKREQRRVGCSISFRAVSHDSISDRTVRIWNLQGDAITVLAGHDSFIYAIVSLPSAAGGGLASSGEDGIVKIWNGAHLVNVRHSYQLTLSLGTDEDGEEEQEILVPALSGASQLSPSQPLRGLLRRSC